MAQTKYRFSGLSHMRQCGDDVLRMLVTGGPPVRGGSGMLHEHRDDTAIRLTLAGLKGYASGDGPWLGHLERMADHPEGLMVNDALLTMKPAGPTPSGLLAVVTLAGHRDPARAHF